ncbi:hypothetical protein [Blastococcus sp. SYSU D00820]
MPLTPLGTAALPRLLARAAAGTGGGCAVLHGGTAAAVPAPARAATVVLAAACLVCAGHLWRRASTRAWLVHAVLAAAMLALHPPLVAAAHHGTAAGTAAGMAAWAALLGGVLAVAALGLAVVRAGCAVAPPT